MTKPDWTISSALHQYEYFAAQASRIADDTRLGKDSESYRSALESAARWLGRYDVLTAWEHAETCDICEGTGIDPAWQEGDTLALKACACSNGA